MSAPIVITADDVKTKSSHELFSRFRSSPQGLSGADAAARLQQYGPNSLEEHKVSSLLKFLSYFWGPIPWMIEIAAILSAVVRHTADLIIILVLLVFNALVGFWQEVNSRI